MCLQYTNTFHRCGHKHQFALTQCRRFKAPCLQPDTETHIYHIACSDCKAREDVVEVDRPVAPIYADCKRCREAVRQELETQRRPKAAEGARRLGAEKPEAERAEEKATEEQRSGWNREDSRNPFDDELQNAEYHMRKVERERLYEKARRIERERLDMKARRVERETLDEEARRDEEAHKEHVRRMHEVRQKVIKFDEEARRDEEAHEEHIRRMHYVRQRAARFDETKNRYH